MDQHVQQLRQRIIRCVTISLVATVTIGAVAAQSVLVALEGNAGNIRDVDAMVRHVPLALLAGGVIALIRLALAFTTNPLTSTYLTRYIASDSAFTERPITGESHGVSTQVTAGGMPAIATLSRGVGDTALIFDLYQSADALITCAVGRRTGSVSLATALSDGRVASTSDMFVPPNEHLVSNIVTNAEVGALLTSHRFLLELFTKEEIRPVAAAPSIWIAAASCEHQSYQELGPRVGVFINVTGRGTFGRLMARIDPAHVLAFALPTQGSKRATRGSTSFRGAKGATKPILPRRFHETCNPIGHWDQDNPN